MALEDHPWYPSSPGQSAAVYSLTLMLLLNTTVLLMVVTGELPVWAEDEPVTTARVGDRVAALPEPIAPERIQSTRAVTPLPTAGVERPQAVKPVVKPAPVDESTPVSNPAPVIRAAHEPAPVLLSEVSPPVAESDTTPEAQPTEPPTQFFGIDIE